MDRKKAVKAAMASMEMEGFNFTPEEKALFDKLAKGEITTDDVKKLAAEKLEKWKQESPQSFVEGS